MIQVYLLPDVIAECHRVARIRWDECQRNKCVDRQHSNKHTGMEIHFLGCLSEAALIQYSELDQALRVNTFHRMADVGRTMDVRATSLPQGHLLLRKRDEKTGWERRQVLAIIPHPNDTEYVTVNLMGWLWGYEAMIDRYWDADRDPPCWLVPVFDLTPISYLPTYRKDI